MIKKYLLTFTFHEYKSSCAYRIRDSFQAQVTDMTQLVDFLSDMFTNHYYQYSKYIGVSTLGGRIDDRIFTTHAYELFVPMYVDGYTKDKFVQRLSAFYDVEDSKYGAQVFNSDQKNCALGSLDILKGKNLSWVFKNGTNKLMLVEHMYDEVTGERLYDCSEFLSKLCENMRKRKEARVNAVE